MSCPGEGLVAWKLVPNPFVQFNSCLKCTSRASCYSIRLSWAHTPVINWVVCLGVTLLDVSDRKEGVVASPTHWAFKNPLWVGAGTEM